jgi:hypothetical protein
LVPLFENLNLSVIAEDQPVLADSKSSYSSFTPIPTTTRNLAFCWGIMPGASTPGKFARSNARDAPGKMTLEMVGPDSHKNRGFDSHKTCYCSPLSPSVLSLFHETLNTQNPQISSPFIDLSLSQQIIEVWALELLFLSCLFIHNLTTSKNSPNSLFHGLRSKPPPSKTTQR